MRLAAVSAAAELRCCADRDQGSERERTCAAMGQIMGPSHPIPSQRGEALQY
jgi:hypothetical protein